jgi:hypothetical protein
MLLENYQSDLSVEADEDDPEVGDNVASRPAVSSATKPRRKTKATIAKQSTSKAAAKAKMAKTAKLEADKKKRKRKASPPLAIPTPIIPTPSTKEVEEDEDEATDDPPIVEDDMARRSLSPAAKRRQKWSSM